MTVCFSPFFCDSKFLEVVFGSGRPENKLDDGGKGNHFYFIVEAEFSFRDWN